MQCCVARHFQDDDSEEVSWFTCILERCNAAWSAVAGLFLRDLLVDRRPHTECAVPCAHPVCVGYNLAGTIVREHSGALCALSIGHSGQCLCGAHAPRVVVDLQVYRPYVRANRERRRLVR